MPETQPSAHGSSTDLPESIQPKRDVPPISTFEALTQPSAGLTDAHGIVEVFRSAAMRVAMILHTGKPAGTAVLVGPDLLLTAAHVLDARESPPSIENVTAHFDFLAGQGMSPAETGIRIRVAEFMAGSLPSDSEVAGQHLDWDAPLDRLDFALIRLAHPVPDAGRRGHYYLDQDDYAFSPEGALYIFQHPLGSPQMVSITTGAIRNAAGTRIRYKANTMQGSSGSPVIDTHGKLVALHHYSTGFVNQGVPSSHIARAVQASPHAEILQHVPLGPSALPLLPHMGYLRLQALGKYKEAAEALAAAATAADPAAVRELALQLRRMGRFADADSIENALPFGSGALSAVIERLRSEG